MNATLAGIGALLLWAFLALLSRLAAGVPPLQLTAMSFAVAAVVGLLSALVPLLAALAISRLVSIARSFA